MSFDLTFFEVKQKLGENDYDFRRRMTAETITSTAKHQIFHRYKNEFERLPDKQTDLQITDEILKDISTHLEKYILNQIDESDAALLSVQFIATEFKNVQMKSSSLSTVVIEEALTTIIDRLNDENTANDELYVALKQAPVSFSYTHDSQLYPTEVRVFEMREKDCQSDN